MKKKNNSKKDGISSRKNPTGSDNKNRKKSERNSKTSNRNAFDVSKTSTRNSFPSAQNTIKSLLQLTSNLQDELDKGNHKVNFKYSNNPNYSNVPETKCRNCVPSGSNLQNLVNQRSQCENSFINNKNYTTTLKGYYSKDVQFLIDQLKLLKDEKYYLNKYDSKVNAPKSTTKFSNRSINESECNLNLKKLPKEKKRTKVKVLRETKKYNTNKYNNTSTTVNIREEEIKVKKLHNVKVTSNMKMEKGIKNTDKKHSFSNNIATTSTPNLINSGIIDDRGKVKINDTIYKHKIDTVSTPNLLENNLSDENGKKLKETLTIKNSFKLENADTEKRFNNHYTTNNGIMNTLHLLKSDLHVNAKSLKEPLTLENCFKLKIEGIKKPENKYITANNTESVIRIETEREVQLLKENSRGHMEIKKPKNKYTNSNDIVIGSTPNLLKGNTKSETERKVKQPLNIKENHRMSMNKDFKETQQNKNSSKKKISALNKPNVLRSGKKEENIIKVKGPPNANVKSKKDLQKTYINKQKSPNIFSVTSLPKVVQNGIRDNKDKMKIKKLFNVKVTSKIKMEKGIKNTEKKYSFSNNTVTMSTPNLIKRGVIDDRGSVKTNDEINKHKTATVSTPNLLKNDLSDENGKKVEETFNTKNSFKLKNEDTEKRINSHYTTNNGVMNTLDLLKSDLRDINAKSLKEPLTIENRFKLKIEGIKKPEDKYIIATNRESVIGNETERKVKQPLNIKENPRISINKEFKESKQNKNSAKKITCALNKPNVIKSGKKEEKTIKVKRPPNANVKIEKDQQKTYNNKQKFPNIFSVTSPTKVVQNGTRDNKDKIIVKRHLIVTQHSTIKPPGQTEEKIISPCLVGNVRSKIILKKTIVNSAKTCKSVKIKPQPSATVLPVLILGEKEYCLDRAYELNLDENPQSESVLTDLSDEKVSDGLLVGQQETGSGDAISWPIRQSLFPNIPPYILFNSYDSQIKMDVRNFETRKHFKWQMTMITPILVKKTVANSGFVFARIKSDTTEESNGQWIGIWGKQIKTPLFKMLKETQKLNHFPGTFHLGRKDRLWRNFQRMAYKFGSKEFGFLPRSYVLPRDLKSLEKNWIIKDGSGKELWILKPPAAARGIGIRVINHWMQLPKNGSLVVQRYISNPLLINGRKFDLRLYVLITSFNPLRIYLYPEGLVRFASAKYSQDVVHLDDKYMHLTNYSINKRSSSYSVNNDANACQGHKWTISTLLEYLKKRGTDTKTLWKHLEELVVKTMIACECPIVALCEENMNNIYNCYELFGVDVLLDHNLKLWLLEINISPSLHSGSTLDCQVKGPLIQNMLNIVQFHMPPAFDKTFNRCCQCLNPKIYTTALTDKEREKHTRFVECHSRDDYLNDILNDLTGDDVRHLTRAEDELVAKGRFCRIFPTSHTFHYLNFLETRYYNRLFDAWETKYANRRNVGVSLLQTLCAQKIHLQLAPSKLISKSSFSTPNLDKNISQQP